MTPGNPFGTGSPLLESENLLAADMCMAHSQSTMIDKYRLSDVRAGASLAIRMMQCATEEEASILALQEVNQWMLDGKPDRTSSLLLALDRLIPGDFSPDHHHYDGILTIMLGLCACAAPARACAPARLHVIARMRGRLRGCNLPETEIDYLMHDLDSDEEAGS